MSRITPRTKPTIAIPRRIDPTRPLQVAPKPAAAAPSPLRETLTGIGQWYTQPQLRKTVLAKLAKPSWAGVSIGQLLVEGEVTRRGTTLANHLQESGLGRQLLARGADLEALAFHAIDTLTGLGLLGKRPQAPVPLAAHTTLERPLARFDGSLPWLGTQGTQIVQLAAGKATPVRLRGVNLSGWEGSVQGDRQTTATLDRLAALGANVVRVPLELTYIPANAAMLAKLDAFVADASKRGLYVILDLHHINGTQFSVPTQACLSFWQFLANRYANQPAVVYDLQNEPQAVAWKDYKPWAQALVDTIRQVNPRALVSVEGLACGEDLAAAAKSPLDSPNVVYQVHLYGAPIQGPFSGPELWQRETAAMLAAGKPVLVGEWGGEADELPYMQSIMTFLHQRGLSWLAWNYGEAGPSMLATTGPAKPAPPPVPLRELLTPAGLAKRMTQMFQGGQAHGNDLGVFGRFAASHLHDT